MSSCAARSRSTSSTNPEGRSRRDSRRSDPGGRSMLMPTFEDATEDQVADLVVVEG
jgi:hypothetical protein